MGERLFSGIQAEQETRPQRENSAYPGAELREAPSNSTNQRLAMTKEEMNLNLSKRLKSKIRAKNKCEGRIEQAELVIDMIRAWSAHVEGQEKKVDLDIYLEDQLERQINDTSQAIAEMDEEIGTVLTQLKASN